MCDCSPCRPWEVMDPKQVYDRCAAAVMAEATPFLGLFSPAEVTSPVA